MVSAEMPFARRLWRASLALGGAHFVRLLLVVLRNKVLAHLLGPEGTGALSQINGVLDVATLLCTFNLSDALARYCAAENSGVGSGVSGLGGVSDAARRTAQIGLILMLGGALLGLVLLEILQRPLARWLLPDANFAKFLGIVACAIPANALYQWATGVLQGAGKVRALAWQGIFHSSIWLLALAGLTARFGFSGGVWAMLGAWWLATAVSFALLAQSGLWNFGLLNLCRFDLNSQVPKIQNPDFQEAARLLSFGGVALFGALAPLVTAVGLRAVILRQFGAAAAGWYQVPVGLSNVCFYPLIYGVGTFMLPHLGSVATDTRRIHAALEHTLRLALLFLVPVSLVVLCAREVLVRLLFSSKFLPGAQMVPYQIAADLGRATVWWLALPLLPTRRYRAAICCDGFGTLLSIGLAAALLPLAGLRGATLGPALAQIFVASCLWIYRRRSDRISPPQNLRVFGLLSALTIGAAIIAAELGGLWILLTFACGICWTFQAWRTREV